MVDTVRKGEVGSRQGSLVPGPRPHGEVALPGTSGSNMMAPLRREPQTPTSPLSPRVPLLLELTVTGDLPASVHSR